MNYILGQIRKILVDLRDRAKTYCTRAPDISKCYNTGPNYRKNSGVKLYNLRGILIYKEVKWMER